MDRLINILATATLILMMIGQGVSVSIGEVTGVFRRWGLMLCAGVINYVAVPAAAVGLLMIFKPAPVVAAGFLIAVCCPGAPFAPSFTSMARGNVAMAVGLMLALAATSALLSPLVLGVTIPMVAGENIGVEIKTGKMIGVLLGSQLLPLVIGLIVRSRNAALAYRLKGPLGKVSLVLNLLLLGLILSVQWRTLTAIRPSAYLGMTGLVAASCALGFVAGWPGIAERTALAMVTSVRNVGVALVIVTSSFGGTGAVTITTAFALLQTLLMALVAMSWTSVFCRGALSAAPSAGVPQ